ncbi:hypothetical protein DFH94DRAFT_688966 [Russula ochroleuca]|uniref:Myb/SANT-like DNA-binding domain-containing protein n=1 Tax=Russula ochroleuca TaxID=152965 RepID=A0A9P5N2B7_9AGAM|nr:hypothetical protein DFH94DRAFT_688966 [Russula ochroleuca]
MNDITQQLLLFLIASGGISSGSAHYAMLLLALEEQNAGKAVWSEEETSAFVHFLYKHRSHAGNRGNFKAAIFDAAAEAISHLLEDGPEKTGEMCKSKWSRIKAIYTSIQKYRASGMHWGIVNGAGINGEAAERAWNSYIAQKSNRAMKPFRNTGWLYYGKVHAIHNSIS